jgi:hypothetical protein
MDSMGFNGISSFQECLPTLKPAAKLIKLFHSVTGSPSNRVSFAYFNVWG